MPRFRPGPALPLVNDIEKFDRLARPNYGLSDNKQGGSGSLNVEVLTEGRTVPKSRVRCREKSNSLTILLSEHFKRVGFKSKTQWTPYHY